MITQLNNGDKLTKILSRLVYKHDILHINTTDKINKCNIIMDNFDSKIKLTSNELKFISNEENI